MRAKTSSPFWTGDDIPAAMLNNPKDTGIPKTGLPLRVARFAANGYGLHDTLGNVEEWVADWHGPYSSHPQRDPLGPDDGTFRGTRGGSHSTEPYYLRTANRAGALPDERSWYIGFRVAAGGAASRRHVSQIPTESPAKKKDAAEERVGNTSWPK
jgi:sulfatase modifying factor 1